MQRVCIMCMSMAVRSTSERADVPHDGKSTCQLATQTSSQEKVAATLLPSAASSHYKVAEVSNSSIGFERSPNPHRYQRQGQPSKHNQNTTQEWRKNGSHPGGTKGTCRGGRHAREVSGSFCLRGVAHAAAWRAARAPRGLSRHRKGSTRCSTPSGLTSLSMGGGFMAMAAAAAMEKKGSRKNAFDASREAGHPRGPPRPPLQVPLVGPCRAVLASGAVARRAGGGAGGAGRARRNIGVQE